MSPLRPDDPLLLRRLSAVEKLKLGIGVGVASSGSGFNPTGTPDGTKFLRDDVSWQTPPGAGGGDSITINAAATTDDNLNDTLPAAPAGSLNVKWQLDTATAPDNVSAYVKTDNVSLEINTLAIRRAALTGDVTAAAGANATTIKNDVALAGNPTTTTQAALNNSTRIATTAYADSAVSAISTVYQKVVERNAASGYAGLDAGGLLQRSALATGVADATTFPNGLGQWIVPQAWPIGSVFTSVVATNPNTLLGYGTWSNIGAGQVLLGLNSGDADFNTLRKTGGAKTVASSAQTFAGNALATHQHAAITAGTPSGTNAGEAAHTHGVTSNVAIAAEAAHTHAAGAISWPAGVPVYTGALGTLAVTAHTVVATKQGAAAGNVVTTATHAFTGVPGGTVAWPAGVPTGAATAAGSSHTHAVTNNAVTSAAGSSHTHAFTGDALATHQHDAITAGTPAGTNTPGAATSVVQPYFVVYFWERTA